VPFSPILGGVTAGYFCGGRRWNGTKVGAYAGVAAAVPVVLVVLVFLGGVLLAGAQFGALSSLVVGIPVAFGLLVAVVYLVGVSALGGYLGVLIGERTRREPSG
jgi:hypothetical protein